MKNREEGAALLLFVMKALDNISLSFRESRTSDALKWILGVPAVLTLLHTLACAGVPWYAVALLSAMPGLILRPVSVECLVLSFSSLSLRANKADSRIMDFVRAGLAGLGIFLWGMTMYTSVISKEIASSVISGMLVVSVLFQYLKVRDYMGLLWAIPPMLPVVVLLRGGTIEDSFHYFIAAFAVVKCYFFLKKNGKRVRVEISNEGIMTLGKINLLARSGALAGGIAFFVGALTSIALLPVLTSDHMGYQGDYSWYEYLYLLIISIFVPAFDFVLRFFPEGVRPSSAASVQSHWATVLSIFGTSLLVYSAWYFARVSVNLSRIRKLMEYWDREYGLPEAREFNANESTSQVKGWLKYACSYKAPWFVKEFGGEVAFIRAVCLLSGDKADPMEDLLQFNPQLSEVLESEMVDFFRDSSSSGMN